MVSGNCIVILQTNLNADQYSHKTRNTVSRMHPDRINMDLIVELLQYLDSSQRFQAIHGAVLVFMPGLAHIQELHEMLTTDKSFTSKNKWVTWDHCEKFELLLLMV